MHPLIETYLQRVERRLRDLSDEQRFEEIRELRQHLLSLVEEAQQRGLNQNEAVREALAQFGPYRRVGRELNRAGRNSAPQRLPKVFSAMTIVMMMQAMIGLSMCIVTPLTNAYVRHFMLGFSPEQWVWYTIMVVLPLLLLVPVAFSLRHLRSWAFWLAFALLSRNMIDEVGSIFHFLSLHPTPGLSDTLSASLWISSRVFCFAVLLLSGRTYFRLARAKRRA